MTRQEYIAQLTAQLYDLPAEEREAAVEYYDGYIADAGEENQEQVLGELGSPQQLADAVKRETKNAGTEGAAADYSRAAGANGGQGRAAAAYPAAGKKLSGGTVLAIILTFPFWLPVLAAAGAMLFALVMVVVSLALAFVLASVGLLFSGAAAIGISIGVLFTTPLEGLMGMGAALICLGLGFCFMAGGTALFRKAVPACWRGLCGLFHRVCGKGGAKV